MKGKIKLLVFVIVAIFLCYLFLFNIQFEFKKQVSIAEPITLVSPQITNLKNWPNWNIELKNRDKDDFRFSDTTNKLNAWLALDNVKFIVREWNEIFVVVESERHSKISYFSISTFPDEKSNFTNVIWTGKLSSFNWLKERFSSTGEVYANLNNLKKYLEDPREYYGFDIQMRNVVDSFVITTSKTVSKDHRFETLLLLYKNIIDFAKQHNIIIDSTTPRMANYNEIGRDSIMITAGIPTNKTAQAVKGVSIKQMPTLGKMLVGEYVGDYNGLRKLYNAMDAYLRDKNLSLVASTYEKYLSNPLSSADSLLMKIEVYYPIR